MTETQIPNLQLADLPMLEAAVVGGVLLAELKGAARILAAYKPDDVTEPRLRVIDAVARLLVAREMRPTPPAIAAEAVDGGHVPKGRENHLGILLLDLVDVTLNPESRVAETYARQLVRASVRRRVQTAVTRLGEAAEKASLADLTTIARSEIEALQIELGRLAVKRGERQ